MNRFLRRTLVRSEFLLSTVQDCLDYLLHCNGNIFSFSRDFYFQPLHSLKNEEIKLLFY